MAVSTQVSLFVVLLASVMFLLAAFDGTKAQAQVLAKNLPYTAESKYLDMSGTSCAEWGANQPPDQEIQYFRWAAFCSEPAECGSCLQVTNPLTEESAVVRVVETQCDGWLGDLELDISVFKEIDSDGDVNGDGYSLVVACSPINCNVY